MANQYLPDYLVHPGSVLEDYLASVEMSQVQLSERTGLAKKTINEIVKGKAQITPETALRLEKVLGRPAHFWNNLERQFQEDRARLESREKADVKWLSNVPVASMVKRGWIKKARDKFEQLENVLSFYGIASPDQWDAVWSGKSVAYRVSPRFAVNQLAIAAWLRKGEIEAQRVACAPYSRAAFIAALDKVRSLTREVPDVFCPEIKKICAESGVVVLFIPELPKTRVCGAARWIGDKAVIQLSLRYKSNDQLFFSLFHEAGHIVKHGRRELFIEMGGRDGCDLEKEADAFASEKLIPKSEYVKFIDGWKRSNAEIEEFARRIGIAPGIVVGRMQHDGVLPMAHGNGLKVFYKWGSD